MKRLFSLLLALLLIAGFSVVPALADNIDPDQAVSAKGLIKLTDKGWSGYSATYDCAPAYTGWGADWWELTLTKPFDVSVKVVDCCCPGDFYEVHVQPIKPVKKDDCIIGTTPKVDKWGCSLGWGWPLSQGSFTVSLQAGTYMIKIRDAGFDGHDPKEIVKESMCPAGYTVSIALAAFTGKYPWPCCVEGASVTIEPETFNKSRQGKWITAHIAPPPGYDAEDIVGAVIVSIDGVACEIEGEIKSPEPKAAVVKFDSAAVAELLPDPDEGPSGKGKPGRIEDVEICVVALLSDGQEACEVCDTIDVIDEGGKKK